MADPRHTCDGRACISGGQINTKIHSFITGEEIDGRRVFHFCGNCCPGITGDSQCSLAGECMSHADAMSRRYPHLVTVGEPVSEERLQQLSEMEPADPHEIIDWQASRKWHVRAQSPSHQLTGWGVYFASESIPYTVRADKDRAEALASRLNEQGVGSLAFDTPEAQKKILSFIDNPLTQEEPMTQQQPRIVNIVKEEVAAETPAPEPQPEAPSVEDVDLGATPAPAPGEAEMAMLMAQSNAVMAKHEKLRDGLRDLWLAPSEQNSPLVAHAARELKLAGLLDEDSDYGGVLGQSILRLVMHFAQQGHSGGSAALTVEVLPKLLRWETLTENDHSLHNDVSHISGYPHLQDARDPRWFSTDGGATWVNVDEHPQPEDPLVAQVSKSAIREK